MSCALCARVRLALGCAQPPRTFYTSTREEMERARPHTQCTATPCTFPWCTADSVHRVRHRSLTPSLAALAAQELAETQQKKVVGLQHPFGDWLARRTPVADAHLRTAEAHEYYITAELTRATHGALHSHTVHLPRGALLIPCTIPCMWLQELVHALAWRSVVRVHAAGLGSRRWVAEQVRAFPWRDSCLGFCGAFAHGVGARAAHGAATPCTFHSVHC